MNILTSKQINKERFYISREAFRLLRLESRILCETCMLLVKIVPLRNITGTKLKVFYILIAKVNDGRYYNIQLICIRFYPLYLNTRVI